MPFPRWLARFNLHVTNRILGPLAKYAPWMAVVVHVGRKTQRRYRTPVVIFRRGEHFLIALTYGRESQWVPKRPGAGRLPVGNQRYRLGLTRPRIVHDPQRRRMPSFVRVMLGLLNLPDFLELSLANAQ